MSYLKNIKFGSKTVPFIKILKMGTSNVKISPINDVAKISSDTTKVEQKGLDVTRTYSNVTYTWNSDFSSCTANAIQGGTNKAITETVASSLLKTVDATHDEDGSLTYGVSFTKKPFEAQFKAKTIPCIGHDYNEPTYEWNEDNTICTAKRTCKDDAHYEEEIGTMTYTVEASTCEGIGHQVATASFVNTAFLTQSTYYGDIPAAGHEYAAPTYSWSSDGKTCTATRICNRNASHVETEVGTTTLGQIDATCLDTGMKVATATFTNTAFTTQSNNYEVIPATGHDWDVPTYTWSEDKLNCTAKRVCKNDASHVETEVGTMTYSTVQATTSAAGGEYSTATFTNTAFTTQKVASVVYPKLSVGVFNASDNSIADITASQVEDEYGYILPGAWLA